MEATSKEATEYSSWGKSGERALFAPLGWIFEGKAQVGSLSLDRVI